GGWGTGTVPGSQVGTPVVATDWTSDNWGQIAIACPEDLGIYYFDPTGGFTNASLIVTAPPFNAGIFVSMSQQILVAFGSAVRDSNGFGWQRDPMQVNWSDVGNFQEWSVTAATQAGGFRLSNGSRIVGGVAGTNQNLLFTDQDLWAMNYNGVPDVF